MSGQRTAPTIDPAVAESHWVRTDVTDAGTGDLVAQVLLHSGVFKESDAGYPSDRG